MPATILTSDTWTLQGLAFVCHQPFNASHYPDLKYQDATGSAMIPESATNHFYLAYLSLASCGLDTWPGVSMVNLHRLHLSHNKLASVSLEHLALLTNLRLLDLSDNPLIGFVGSNTTIDSLQELDLSFTLVSKLSDKFSCSRLSWNASTCPTALFRRSAVERWMWSPAWQSWT
jgi:hypothetical protein